MSEFEGLKKMDLARFVRKLGHHVRSKDTKLNLLEKLYAYKEVNPEGYQELVDSIESTEDAETATLVGDDATEDEEEDETDVAEDIAEEKPYDAPPPIDFNEYIVDPVTAFFKEAYFKYFGYDDLNDVLRLHLSSAANLAQLELAFEVLYFLYVFVPIVDVRKNKFLPQLFKDNMSFITVFPDFSTLFKWNVISVLLQWVLYAVVAPGLVSYYINFTRKTVVLEASGDEDYEEDDEEIIAEVEVEEDEEDDDEDDEDYPVDDEDLTFLVRFHKYDPVIFSLAKVVIFYFIVNNGILNHLDVHKDATYVLTNFVHKHFGFYHDFVADLGNFPLVLGAANIIVGLYSQFEDI